MDNNLSKLKKEAQKIRLSEAEKSAMRARIFGAPKSSTPSPYVVASFFSFRMAASFVMVLLLVVGSTSAYAAQGSLPGDALYTFKTRVNEPVAGAFALSSEAKANHYAALAERRMEEAETLAANGKLDVSTAKKIEDKLALHVEAADKVTTKLTQEDPGTAAEVTARFASSLSAHSEILERLGSDSESGDTKDSSGKLAMYVRENITWNSRWGGRNAGLAMSLKVGQAANADVMLFTSEAPASSSDATSSEAATAPSQASVEVDEEENEADQKSAEQVRRKAKEAYDEVRGVYSDVRRKLSATTTADINVKLTAIEDYIEIGELLLEEEEYDEAQDEFMRAIEESVRLEALIKAGKKFNKNLLEDLLWGKGEEKEPNEGEDEGQKGGIIPGIEVQIGL